MQVFGQEAESAPVVNFLWSKRTSRDTGFLSLTNTGHGGESKGGRQNGFKAAEGYLTGHFHGYIYLRSY